MKSMMMKKLVVTAVVAAVSLVGRADNLYWSASDIKSSSDNTLTGTGQYLAYLFCTKVEPSSSWMAKNSNITTMDTILGLLASENKGSEIESYAKVYNSSTARTNDDYSNNTASITADNGYFGNIGTDTTTGYGLVSVFAVVFDAATYDDAKNYMVLTDSDGNPMEKKLTQGWGTGKTTYDFGSQANNTWHAIGTVPEPTSGLLLLVGVAALALRRKYAA